MEEKDYWVVDFGNLNMAAFEELEEAMLFIRTLKKGTLLTYSFHKKKSYEVLREARRISLHQAKESEILWQLS